jgi:hypothetical protein
MYLSRKGVVAGWFDLRHVYHRVPFDALWELETIGMGSNVLDHLEWSQEFMV